MATVSRSKIFNPEREPLRDYDRLRLNNEKIHGPFSFLNPTQAHFNHVRSSKTSADSEASDEAERPTEEKPEKVE